MSTHTQPGVRAGLIPGIYYIEVCDSVKIVVTKVRNHIGVVRGEERRGEVGASAENWGVVFSGESGCTVYIIVFLSPRFPTAPFGSCTYLLHLSFINNQMTDWREVRLVFSLLTLF
jgi:hypothetical protein